MSEEEHDGEKEKKQAEPESEEGKLPKDWKDKPIQDWVDQGYRLGTKRVDDVTYIALRKGKNQHTLGLLSPERWDLLLGLFPKLKATLSVSPERRDFSSSTVPATGLLSTRMVKPQGLSEKIGFTMETLHWYEWAKQKKYSGSLSDFVSEIVHEYFLEHGIQIVAVIDRGVGEAE